MTLIKKTVVLVGGTPKGYLTVVRVGGEIGAKIVGESFSLGWKAYVKVGAKTQLVTLAGKKTEIELGIPFENADELGCVILDEEKIIASGGKSISEKEMSLYKADEEEKPEPLSFANAETIIPPSLPDKEDTVTEESVNNPDAKVMDTKEIRPEIEPMSEVVAEDDNNPAKENNLSENVEIAPQTDEAEDELKKKEEEQLKEELFERLSTEKDGYYIGISDKVDELFVVYPAEKMLAAIIPDSEWVKINYDNDDYYVVGRLKEGGRIAYLGYGVPGKESVKPPKIADGIANWLPVSELDGYDGYWLFFQNADTGKIDA